MISHWYYVVEDGGMYCAVGNSKARVEEDAFQSRMTSEGSMSIKFEICQEHFIIVNSTIHMCIAYADLYKHIIAVQSTA